MSSLLDLQKKIAEKEKQENQMIETETKKMIEKMKNQSAQKLSEHSKELERLSKKLIESSTDELNVICTNIIESVNKNLNSLKKESKKIKKSKTKQAINMIVHLIIILAFSSAIVFGIFKLNTWRVQGQIMKLEQLKQTQKNITTWGLTLSENGNGKFIILPAGTTIQDGFKAGKHGKREALKLIKK